MDRRTEKSTGKFATRDELDEAVRMHHDEGMPHSHIGIEVGVSKATVRRILKGEEEPKIKYVEERNWAEGQYLREKLNTLWQPVRSK